MAATLRNRAQATQFNSVAAPLTSRTGAIDRRCLKASMPVNYPPADAPAADAPADEIDAVAEFFAVVVAGEKESAKARELGFDPGHFNRIKSGTKTLPYAVLYRLAPADWVKVRTALDQFHGTASEQDTAEVELDALMALVRKVFELHARKREGR